MNRIEAATEAYSILRDSDPTIEDVIALADWILGNTYKAPTASAHTGPYRVILDEVPGPVTIRNTGGNPHPIISVVKELRTWGNLTLQEAKDLTDRVRETGPKTVMETNDEFTAEIHANSLIKAGAKAHVE